MYVAVRFLTEGKEDDKSLPDIKINIEQILADENALEEGSLFVHAIHAKGLLPADTGIMGNGLADPYVKVIMPNGDS